LKDGQGRTLHFAVPGALETPTGGYAYARRMAAELASRGWQIRLVELAAGFPLPENHELEAAERAFAHLPDGALAMIDGLAFGAMPEIAERHCERLRLAALVHHPLAEETGLDDATAARLHHSERRALAAAQAVICTSRHTASRLVSIYGVPSSRLVVVEPGTDPQPRARPERQPPLLLSLGALIPRKGHDLLIEALAILAGHDWRARLVGSRAYAPAWAAHIEALAARRGLQDRIRFADAVADAGAELAAAQIFVLPSHHEGFGMAFAEAMSSGLPVVGCKTGAVPDLVPETAGLLVPPGDVHALVGALGALVDDVGLRCRLARGALRAAGRLPSWDEAGARLAAILARIAA
jgi:glycosyltransferase involved in cell wall biosynthesis